jgi:hypothetical protein
MSPRPWLGPPGAGGSTAATQDSSRLDVARSDRVRRNARAPAMDVVWFLNLGKYHTYVLAPRRALALAWIGKVVR